MRIALVTCCNLPSWETDDQPLHDALVTRGVFIERPAWDDPAIDWSRYDGCLIRTTWDYMERRDHYVAWAERVDRVSRLFNSSSVVRWNTDKSYLVELASRGAPTTPSVWIEPKVAFCLESALRDHGWRRGFLKPAIGATARETMRFDAMQPAELEAAAAHLRRMGAHGEAMILQPYLGRVETEGEISAIIIDGAVTHTVRKVPVRGDYRVQDDFGASDEPYTLPPDALRLAFDIIDLVDDDLLYARVDFLRDDDGALRLSELELVEPSLFFRHGSHAADRLAEALLDRIENG